MKDEQFEYIHVYSRRQALEDGVLVDVSEQARLAGFKVSVAVSQALYAGYIMPDEKLLKEGQSAEGRLHDLLTMVQAAAVNRWDGSRVEFDCIFLMRPRIIEKVRCVATIGPGDSGEAVLTIFLPLDE